MAAFLHDRGDIQYMSGTETTAKTFYYKVGEYRRVTGLGTPRSTRRSAGSVVAAISKSATKCTIVRRVEEPAATSWTWIIAGLKAATAVARGTSAALPTVCTQELTGPVQARSMFTTVTNSRLSTTLSTI